MFYAILILLALFLLALWAYAGLSALADGVFHAMSAADDTFEAPFFGEGEATPGLPGLGGLSLEGASGPGGWAARLMVPLTLWLERHPGLRRSGWRGIYGAVLLFLFASRGLDRLRGKRTQRRGLRRQLLREVVRAHLVDSHSPG